MLDDSGKEGGLVLVEGLSLLCDGDMDSAMSLREGVDYSLRGVAYNPRLHTLDRHQRGRSYGQAKLWFLRRLQPAEGG